MIRSKWNNRGMSLVELIVVIAILAVLATGLIGIMGILGGKQAREAAQDIATSLGKIRVMTMSKSAGAAADAADADVYLKVSRDSSGNIMIRQVVSGTVTDSIVIKGNHISHFYVYIAKGGNSDIPGGTVPVELDENGIILAYDRGNGTFLPFSAVNATYIKQLKIMEGTKAYCIKLVPATGKTELGD